jgi:hypothetical protein
MSKARITDFNFFFGGRALFTVSSPVRHFTFKIRTKKDDPSSPFFVSMLVGPDNYSNYQYIGILNEETGALVLTRASKFKEDTDAVRAFSWALRQVKNGNALPDGYNIQHEGKCCRCGRRLTDPVSIEMGIGPKCRGE